MTLTDPIALLRESELRVTRPRVAVLKAVTEHPHAGVDAIAAQVREQLGSVSTQAVYDVLGALTTAGLLRHVEPAGSPARFEMQHGDNHHHVVCRSCGAIQDVPCAAGRTPCLDPLGTNDFVINEAEVTYWGLCPGCARSTVALGSKRASG